MTTLTVAQGARSQLLIKKQSGLGSLATGLFTAMRYNSHSLSRVKSSVEGGEIRSDREITDVRHGNYNVQGDISFDLCYINVHWTLMESALFSTFTTRTDDDQLIIGTSPQYLSMEDAALDIAKYRMYQDMLCSRMSFSFRTGADAIVRCSSSWIGTDGGLVQNTSGSTTPNAASTLLPFDTFSGSISEQASSGSTSVEIANVASVEINIDNGVAPIYALGQQSAIGVEYGRGRVTGTVTCYYSDHRWLDDFLDEQENVLVVTAFDPVGNKMTWRMDRVKYMAGDVPVDREQSRMITLPFVALKDTSATPGSALEILKDPA